MWTLKKPNKYIMINSDKVHKEDSGASNVD